MTTGVVAIVTPSGPVSGRAQRRCVQAEIRAFTWWEGRYTVGPRLARGGTGGVYRAVDQRLERTVAVKILHAHLTEDHPRACARAPQ
jgi:hypothetical protein